MYFGEGFEISSHDIDLNNNIKPSNLVRYMQECANHQMRDRKPTFMELLDEGKAFVVTRMSIEVYGVINQYDRIEARTWNCKAGHATFKRGYEIVSEGEVLARAYSEWALNDIRKGGVMTADNADLSNYERGEVPDLEIPKRFRYPKDMEFTHVGDYKIIYRDLDMNGHMNNTHYPDILWSYIPEIQDKQVTSMNIRFYSEGSPGSDMKIDMARATPEFLKDGNAEEGFCFRTFVNGKKNVEIMFGVRRVR